MTKIIKEEMNKYIILNNTDWYVNRVLTKFPK